VLLNIPEIFGGGGKNIAQKYMGTVVLNGSPVTLSTTVDNNNQTLTLSGGFSLDDKQVYLMDQEQFYTVDSNATVLRGIGSSSATGHSSGTVLYESTLEQPRTNISAANDADSATDTCLELDSTANIEKGDLLIVSYFQSVVPEYLLVKKVGASTIASHDNCIDSGTDNVEVVRGMFGSPVQDWTNLTTIAGVGEYTERGPVDSLWASSPVFRTTPNSLGHSGESWQALNGGTASGTQAVLRFAIDAKGENGLDFEDNDGSNDYGATDDLLQVRLTGNVDNSGLAQHLSSCSLENVTPGNTETLDTVDLAGTSITATGIDLNFDFFTHGLHISANGTAVLEVRCNMAMISGESVAAMIDTVPNLGAVNLDQTSLATSTVIYSDGMDATIDEDAENIAGLKLIGPGFVGS